MINARIDSIRVVDDELFNRIVAFGPGDGINRVSVTVEDAHSMAAYGVREKVETFVDATDRDSLALLASAYLEEHKEPVTEMQVTLFSEAGEPLLESVLHNGEAVTYAGEDLAFWSYGDTKDVRRGDTIRIVSQSLKLNTTGIIEELSWEPGQVTLTINKKRYNLLEVINGPEREDERQENALGLPVPLSFRAQRASPGIRVSVNPYTNSRASGVEVYASTTPSFTPTREFLLVRGTATEFLFPDLASGSVFYFRARSYDNQGNHSEFTDQVAAVSGYVDGGRIGEGTITDLTPFASALTPPRLVVSLPLVPDPDYELGDLIAFDGDIYKLVSETGVLNTDWQELADLTELDGRLIAGRLVAAQIEAGAIRAEQIAADAVTADKMLVNGPVTVANNATGQDGAFVVLDDSNEEILRLGAGIGDKAGVPSGTNYGLWGISGTGIFIEDSPRLIGIGGLLLGFTGGPYTSANVNGVAWSIASSSFTIPVGFRRIYIFGFPYQDAGLLGGGGAGVRWDTLFLEGTTNGSTWSTFGGSLSAGTYSELSIRLRFSNFTTPATTGVLNIPYFAYEVNT